MEFRTRKDGRVYQIQPHQKRELIKKASDSTDHIKFYNIGTHEHTKVHQSEVDLVRLHNGRLAFKAKDPKTNNFMYRIRY